MENIEYLIEPAKSGVPTLFVYVEGKRMPVHSAMDPLREAEAMADRFMPERYDILIVLGTGLGYHLLGLREMVPRYRSIICIDIMSSVRDEIRQNAYSAFLAQSPNVQFVSGIEPSQVAQVLDKLITIGVAKGISVIEHPGSFRLFPDYYDACRSAVNQVIDAQAGNQATIKAFGRRFLDNIIANTRRLGTMKPVSGLFGAFKGFPALMVVPGPSLDEQLQILEAVQDRCFIVAVDSALQVMRHRHIKADFVVSIDPQPYIAEHMPQEGQTPAVTVFSFSVNPAATRRLTGFLSLTSHPLCQIASAVYGSTIGSIDAGAGSVAGDALRLCRELGFGITGILGLDFSFPDGSIYARGSAYQDRYALFQQGRFNPIETANQRYIRTASGNLSSGGIKTRRSLLGYKAGVENYLRDAATEFRAINGRGLPLNGVIPMSLESFSGEYCAALLNKDIIISGAVAAIKPLDPAPFLSALEGLARGEDFAALLDASLGRPAGALETERYRRLVGSIVKDDGC